MTQEAIFTPRLFEYLRALKRNNNRAWFKDNKQRYLDDVRDPLLEFIIAFEPHLKKISKHFVADSRPNGGSMFRIYRDVRFSKDKSPYKTHAAAHFRHEAARDVHAPGFYLHLEPGNVMVGAGIWRPDGKTLRNIREFIIDNPRAFEAIFRGKRFKTHCELSGEKLSRPPRGFDPEHKLIEYLKRKDFLALARFDEKDACAPTFVKHVADRFKAMSPLAEYITDALDLPY